ncbi:MAG: hypothetical protein LAT51_11185, partial [Flavobacteriaceae bacterium]|nr:hypothetical protein [Flavobacteriaceae bacterium]
AHTNTITPTQTAYFILEKLLEQEQYLSALDESLRQSAFLPIENNQITLKEFQTKIIQELRFTIENQNSSLKNIKLRIDKSSLYFLSKHINSINETHHKVKLNTLSKLKNESEELDANQRNLSFAYQNIHLKKEYELNLLANKIQLYSPEDTFKRGYSIITKNDKLMKNIHQLNVDDLITIKMHKGKLEAIITKKENL